MCTFVRDGGDLEKLLVDSWANFEQYPDADSSVRRLSAQFLACCLKFGIVDQETWPANAFEARLRYDVDGQKAQRRRTGTTREAFWPGHAQLCVDTGACIDAP